MFEQVLGFVQDYPWAIERTAGERVADILARRVSGERATVADLAMAAEIRAERDRKKQKAKSATVAYVPLHGVMMPRADYFMEVSGLMSTTEVGHLIDRAAADPAIEVILLDIDSPGGSVFGTEELGNKVRAAGKKKKTIAVANNLAASAAFWVGTQASEFVASPSAMVGSLGVFNMHVDRSGELANAGIKVTLTASSPEKVAANEFAPLDELGRSEQERVVNGYFRRFLKAVADGRRVTQAEARDNFGRGGVVLAHDAANRGMVDSVASIDDILARYGIGYGVSGGSGSGQRAEAKPPAPKAFDSALELRKRKLRLSLDDDRARFAALSHRAANPPQPAPPAPPKLTRPAGRTAEEDRRTAYHEAGHAAVALALRVPVAGVTIQPGTAAAGPYNGCMDWGAKPDGWQTLCVCLAGAAAELRFAGSYTFVGPDEDLALATGAIPGWGTWARAEERVREIIAANHGPITALANALLAERTMTGDRIKQVAGRVSCG